MVNSQPDQRLRQKCVHAIKSTQVVGQASPGGYGPCVYAARTHTYTHVHWLSESCVVTRKKEIWRKHFSLKELAETQ